MCLLIDRPRCEEQGNFWYPGVSTHCLNISLSLSKLLTWLHALPKNNRFPSDAWSKISPTYLQKWLLAAQILFCQKISCKFSWILITFLFQSILMTLTLLILYWRTSIQPLFFKRAFKLLLSGATLYLFIYCGALWWWVLNCTSGRMCNQTCNETVVSDCHQLQLIILSRIPYANRW